MKLTLAVLSILFLVENNVSTSISQTNDTFVGAAIASSKRQEGFEFVNAAEELACDYAPGLSLGSREKELECCRSVERRYEFFWAGRSLPLNRYLATLKGWSCPHFQVECGERVFAFNTFTELLYDYFCNYTTFLSKCVANVSVTIQNMQKRVGNSNSSDSPTLSYPKQDRINLDVIRYENQSIISKWRDLLSQIQPSKMTIDELLQPCVQVAQYDREEVHNGGFEEIVDFGIPSCKIAWCGLGAEAMEIHQVSIWTCLASE